MHTSRDINIKTVNIQKIWRWQVKKKIDKNKSKNKNKDKNKNEKKNEK